MMVQSQNQSIRVAASLLVAAMMGVVVQNAAAGATNTPPTTPRQPNIIFILADDLGYGDLGCYGQPRIKTPNLDQLAADGIRFTSCYSGSTVCAPSRAALMLGQHTGHVYLRGNSQSLPLQPDHITAAKVLRDAGYRTAMIGKWALGDENTTGVPELQGFDEVLGYLNQTHAHDYYTDHLWRHDPTTGRHGRITLHGNLGGKRGEYTHDLFTTAALNFVKINKPDPFNRHRPFFLYLAYTIPHVNNEENRRTGNGMQVPSAAPYADEPWPAPEKNKAAMITRLDADIGRLRTKLKELKIDTNTVIFFTSDNGPHAEGVDPKFHQSAGPLRGIKRDLYEGGIRVPMIVNWPAQIRPGQVSDFAWANWDFLPTAADIAMTKAPKDVDGISIYPLLTGQAQTNRHEFFYWEFHERGFQQAARMGDWKAFRPQAGEPLELYNLKTDLGEKQDIAKNNPEVVAKFEAYFKTARTESPNWPIKKPEKKSAKVEPEKP
jgi:arylsulfatase A-like enzyme